MTPTSLPPREIETIRIADNSLCIYSTYTGKKERSEKQVINESNLTRGQFNGELSSKSQSQIKRQIAALVNTVKSAQENNIKNSDGTAPFLTFVTLTLSSKQIHSDNEIKKACLVPFIQELRECNQVEGYIWKAEIQKNGNIHFHIVVDRYIKWREIRSRWNRIQNKLGYVDRYQEKHSKMTVHEYLKENKPNKLVNQEKLIKRYQTGKKENWSNPNSTDIHKLESITHVSTYIAKYITKNGKGRKIEGRLHGCSDSIQKIKLYSQFNEYDTLMLIRQLENNDNFQVKEDDGYKIIIGPVMRYIKEFHPSIERRVKEFYMKQARIMYESWKIKEELEVVEEAIEVKREKTIQMRIEFN